MVLCNTLQWDATVGGAHPKRNINLKKFAYDQKLA